MTANAAAGLPKSGRRAAAGGPRRRRSGGVGKSHSGRTRSRLSCTFERLESLYPKLDGPSRFADLCRRLITANPQDWRARLALGQHLAAGGQSSDALELLFEALVHNPHGLTIHTSDLADTEPNSSSTPHSSDDMSDLTRDAIFYLDPHVCMRCRYRSTELLWQCPQCHEWNTFVEERITSS